MVQAVPVTSRTVPAAVVPAQVPLLPAAAFVLVWSSGYIAGPAGVAAMAPFSVLVLRFAVAALLLYPLARWLRGPLVISRADLGRVAASGLAMNALLFGLMYVAFERGMSATLGALLHSLSPVLTAVLAGVFMGERLTRRQVLGFAAGVLGVVVVLGPDVDDAGGLVGLTLGLLSLLCLSLGTLGQRWIGVRADPSGRRRCSARCACRCSPSWRSRSRASRRCRSRGRRPRRCCGWPA